MPPTAKRSPCPARPSPGSRRSTPTPPARSGRLADTDPVAAVLSEAGFVAADEEAAELVACAGDDVARLRSLVARRLTGEPLAWIVGRVSFCDLDILVDPGVYVPRWHSEPLARRAAELLPRDGAAVDLCTGSGAIARTLAATRPRARVVASDIDRRAVACAARNGIEIYHGDLFAPLPDSLVGRVDVVVGVVPYVPTPALTFLQRDTLTFESAGFYDGGADGTDVLRAVLAGAPRYLRRAGTLLLELGAGQAEGLEDNLDRHGFGPATLLIDSDGDVRGIETTLAGRSG